MNAVLVSTYELGRQPFGLASPAARLRRDGIEVTCQDLAVEELDEETVARADLVAFYLPMHTATRLAVRLVGRVQQLNPYAHLCFYGLYASLNESYLRKIGGATILGGEFEESLVSLANRLATSSGPAGDQPERLVSLARQQFLVPDRRDLPTLDNYARLQFAPGDARTVGYTEASRGCKHLCRHCPIVPVYNGAFRVVQTDVVVDDIRQQVDAGAAHITFGDPDFFNGPTHAVRLVKALHREFPDLTYDVTIKVEHLLKHRELLPVLRDTGCLFVTSAVESIDHRVLEIFDKRHARGDLARVVALFRELGLHLNPTFVTFTPWTTLAGYVELLHTILDLDLTGNVAPIQYAIRLLIPRSSRLLELEEVQREIGGFDDEQLCYPWRHSDPRVDRLHQEVLEQVQRSQADGHSRAEVFQRIWRIAHDALGRGEAAQAVADLGPLPARATVPYLTEPWYC